MAGVPTVAGTLCLCVGSERTREFAVTRRVDKADRRTAWEVPEHLPKVVRCRIQTILTDTGLPFAEQPRNRTTRYSRQRRFGMICAANAIEHRLTKPTQPWSCEKRKQSGGQFFPSDGQLERRNRTITEGDVNPETIHGTVSR
jgi:hypothetical protein